jgi:CheY-like chemotaxis protein
MLEAMLAPPYEVCSYETGAAAVNGIIEAPPDAILMDMSLPDMTGREALERLRKAEALRGVPVIAVSAHAMSGDREAFLAAGFDAYFSKPIADLVELRRTLERLAKR